MPPVINEKTLPRLQLFGMLALVLLFSLGLGVHFTLQHMRDFQAGLDKLEGETLRQQQGQLEAEVASARNYLNFVRSRTESVLKTSLRQQVDQAMEIAEGIYRREKGRLPEAEIKRLIVEALRPVRFFDGRGYFFIDDDRGNCVLLPIAPEREGSSLLDNQDDTGHYVMRGLMEAASNDVGAGFSRYRWFAPGNTREMANKIAYVRRFEPFGWLIGSGEYLFKIEEDLQREALDRLRALRFGKEGYLAVMRPDGTMLALPAHPEAEGRKYDALANPGERQVIQQILQLAEHGGGFTRYQWPRPGGGEATSKLSYVQQVDTWDWILVAGLYLDDLEVSLAKGREALHQRVLENIRTTALVLTVAAVVTLLFSLAFSRWLAAQFRRYRHDIEARNAQLLENARQLKLAAQVFESGSEGMVITDPHNRILTVNRAFTAITGYTAAEVLGQDPKIFSSGRHDPEFYAALWDELQATGTWAGEIWNRRKDGSVFPEWISISAVRDESGQVSHHIAAFSDITERKAVEAKVRHMAEYDALTNLPNRVLLNDRIGQAIASDSRSGAHLALLFLDLDRFKNINDSLGHAVGDQVLCRVSERLRACVRASDTVSRLGGDEFVILLPELEAPDQAAGVAKKLIAAIAEPITVGSYELSVTPSIGIALFPEDGDDGETLLKNADAAMYHAKELGRNRYQYFTQEMNTRVSERLAMENSLRQALQRDELVLYYQPQFDLRDGQLVGCEALVRWRHPELGMIPPGRFIPVAEESGLILPIGTWVLQEACRQARAWQDQGLAPITMAVNLPAVQFRHARLVQIVQDALADSGLDAQWLELELTESMLMADVAHNTAILGRFKAMGIRLALDDFGTGYSSLSYLKRFALDKLKIDRSFVQELPDDAEDGAITAAIIGIARHLGLDTIAEGVETEAQRDFLAAQGCAKMQGFLGARPLPAAELATLLFQETEARIARRA